ncbi:MAG TPA: hypothetical protein VFI08_06470, partial [Spirochaetia bacterium]|nr:hypothetical protein [Spirochaetia bacterium]
MGRLKLPAIALVLLALAAAGSFGQAPGTPAGQPETVSYLIVHLLPTFNLPMGDSASYYKFGGGALIGAEYRLPFFSNLFVLGGVGYDYNLLKMTGQSASFPNALAGAGLQFNLAPW